jgi:hypothetical protein
LRNYIKERNYEFRTNTESVGNIEINAEDFDIYHIVLFYYKCGIDLYD